MGRLKMLPPRLKTLAPRIAPPPQTEQERHRRRDAEQAWRAWYKTARWQRLRWKILKRDHFTCQQTGELLTGKHPEPNSAVVDHKIPHRGDPVLFWDEDNLQTVSKSYHDSIKQAEEKAARNGDAQGV